MKLLYMTLCAPYRTVRHAGGQTVYYYLSRFLKEEDFDVKLMTFCSEQEAALLDEEEFCSAMEKIVVPDGIKKFIWNCQSIGSKINPWYRYGNGLSKRLAFEMIKRLKSLKMSGYAPDVIIMEWTEIILYIEVIKEIFPDAKYVSSEHLIEYQKIQREEDKERNYMIKGYLHCRMKNMKGREKTALNHSDLIIIQNEKDKRLLEGLNLSVSKMLVISAFYHRSKIEYQRKNNNILFFGAMKRKENIDAVRWFARHVMPGLTELDCSFIVIGSEAKETLSDIECENIKVIGFVDEIDRWFAEAMCVVVPLRLGGGIKIKCLEALYSGIPLLTNEIGIEGIPAKDRRDYYHCVSASDYIGIIKELYYSRGRIVNGKKMVEDSFPLESSCENYIERIRSLVYETDEDIGII